MDTLNLLHELQGNWALKKKTNTPKLVAALNGTKSVQLPIEELVLQVATKGTMWKEEMPNWEEIKIREQRTLHVNQQKPPK